MQLSKTILVWFAASAITLAAHATPILYTIAGDSGQLTGTVTADSNGIYSGNVTFNDGTKSYTFSGTVAGGGPIFSGTYIYGQWQDSSGNEILIYVTPGNDVLCSTATPCTVSDGPFGTFDLNTKLILYNDDIYTASSGYLTTDVGNAPEPSSLALLGTGLLGVLAAGHRRFRRV